MHTVHLLLTEYFNQIIILLGAFGAITNHYLTRKSKNIEIRATLFHQNKTLAINRFIECYVEVSNMWWQLPHYQLFDEVDIEMKEKITSEEVDKMIIPPQNRFESAFYLAAMHLSSKELCHFEEIYTRLRKLRGEFTHLRHHARHSSSKVDKFYLELMDCRKFCKTEMAHIAKLYQNTFDKV